MSQFYTKTIGSGGYVEFIGVAGAGKTEAANILVSKLMEHNILARRRTPIGYNPLLKIRLFFSLVLLVGKLNYLLFDLIFFSIKREFSNANHVKKIVVGLVLRILIDATVVKYYLRTSSEVLVNDEGLLQKVSELLVLTNLDLKVAVKILNKILPEELIGVCVDVQTKIAFDRAENRGTELPFLDSMDENKKKVFYERTYEMWNKIISYHTPIHGLSILSIDNSKDINVLSSQLETLVASTFSYE